MPFNSHFMTAVTAAKDPLPCMVVPLINTKKDLFYPPFSKVDMADRKRAIREMVHKKMAVKPTADLSDSTDGSTSTCRSDQQGKMQTLEKLVETPALLRLTAQGHKHHDQDLNQEPDLDPGFKPLNHVGLSWNSIPEVIMIKIYQNLSLLDRAMASGVCRHWYDIYKLPVLWHKFEFEFTQESTSYVKSTPPKLVKQVVQQHAKHLKYVTIKVDSHQDSAEAACNILSELVNCSLKTLELMLTARPSFHLVNPVKLLTPLTVVLVNSPSLSSLALDETPIDDPWLESMALSNKDSLMLLKIDNCSMVSSKGMLHVADTCRQLHELNINYMHLSDDLLLALSREEHVKLKHLCVNVICEDKETSMQKHVIKKESWDALAKHSPSTIVSMCFYVLHDQDFSPFFKYETPATHVYFGRSVSREILIRMGQHCPKLQELVICANGNQPLDEPIVTIASKCQSLYSLGLGECEVSCSCVVEVARLCGKRLTEFFIREEVLSEDDAYDVDSMSEKVSQYIGRTWSAECMPFWNE